MVGAVVGPGADGPRVPSAGTVRKDEPTTRALLSTDGWWSRRGLVSVCRSTERGGFDPSPTGARFCTYPARPILLGLNSASDLVFCVWAILGSKQFSVIFSTRHLAWHYGV